MKSERVEWNDKLQTRTEKRPFKWKMQNLASQDSCLRPSNDRDERNHMLKREPRGGSRGGQSGHATHVKNAQVINVQS